MEKRSQNNHRGGNHRSGRIRRRKAGNRLNKWLSKSPINFFSDLLMCTIGGGYFVTLAVMLVMAVYTTTKFGDTSMWSEIRGLVEATTCGTGGIWLCKCTAQHVIAGAKGKTLEPDFPNAENTTDFSAVTATDATNEGAVG